MTHKVILTVMGFDELPRSIYLEENIDFTFTRKVKYVKVDNEPVKIYLEVVIPKSESYGFLWLKTRLLKKKSFKHINAFTFIEETVE